MKVYDIWAEGYRCTSWQSSGATLVGQACAETFQEACDKYATYDEDFKQLYDPERLTYWGCDLFDNQRDAQRNFG